MMKKTFILLMILLLSPLSLDGVRVHYVSLCSGEDVSQDKLELPPQSEEGTNTPAAGEIQPQAEETAPPPAMTQAEQSQETAATVPGTTAGSMQLAADSQQEGTESDAAGSSTLDTQTGMSVPLSTEASATGSPTLSSQATSAGTASEPASAMDEKPYQPSITEPFPIVGIVGTDTTAGTSSDTTGSPTVAQIDTPPSGIWGKIGSWITAFSGTPTITGSPSITGLMLMPTAYRLDKQRKLNADFVFSYYLGELWTKYKERGTEKVDIFNPINRLSCSGDFKYSLIPEKKWIPAAALGYQGFIVLQGKASSAGAMGGAVSDKSDSFGYSYAILSKRFKNIGIHIGSQSGPIGKFINPLSNKLNITSNSALIAGLDTTICKRTAFIELIYPQGKECMMINTSIDNFLPFNFTCIRFNNKLSNAATLTGYSVTGYFKARTTGFPGEKKGKKK